MVKLKYYKHEDNQPSGPYLVGRSWFNIVSYLFFNIDMVMVLQLDGSSEHGEYILNISGSSIC